MSILNWRIRRERLLPDSRTVKVLEEAVDKLEMTTEKLKKFADELREQKGKSNDER